VLRIRWPDQALYHCVEAGALADISLSHPRTSPFWPHPASPLSGILSAESTCGIVQNLPDVPCDHPGLKGWGRAGLKFYEGVVESDKVADGPAGLPPGSLLVRLCGHRHARRCLTGVLSDEWEGTNPRYSRYLLTSRSFTVYPPRPVLFLHLPN